MRKIAPGAVLRLWSEDAFCGALRSVADMSSEKVDLRFVNPQTGPFYVEGAEPGDTLALHLVSLEPARDWGASAAIPFFGGLTSTDRTATLQEALPDTTWIYHLDSAARTCIPSAPQRAHRRPAARADARHRGRRAGVQRGAQLARARPLRRQHGHPADARGHNLLPRGQRRGRVVLHRGWALPAGRGRVLRHSRRGSDDDDTDRRADQGLGAGLAAARGRRPHHDRRLKPPARGRLARVAGRDGPLAHRAVRPAHDGRLPAALADL